MIRAWSAQIRHGEPVFEGHRPLLDFWHWVTANGKKILPSRENRRLRVAETVSLGDRRFVVLLEADGEHFLVGASATGVTLLTKLSEPVRRESAACANPVTQERQTDGSSVPETNASPIQEQAAPVSSCHLEDIRLVSDSAGAPPRREVPVQAVAQIAQVNGAAATTPHELPSASGFRMFPTSASVRRHAFPTSRALLLLLALQISPLHLVPAAKAQSTSSTSAVAAPRTAQSQGISRTALPSKAPASPGGSGLSLTGLGSSSAPWTIVVLLTVLTLIPSLMICMTPFARLLVVFHFLRQALGLQTTPSNQTLIGLSLILTFFIMEPLGKQIYNGSFIPLQNGKITALEAVDRGSEPLRHFMAHYVREKDAALFLEIAHAPRPKSIEDVSLRVLMPAYIVSELKAGFQIGAVLFLPFLVVDIVIASITTSVGMMQLPPVVISTPLKLMLFLMVDGWHLLIGALVRSFY